MSLPYTNHLAGESSPYLLQHAHNPVDWYPWGDEALQLAKQTDRPLLVSIGYAACHWCHVMERESFEDEEVAAIMNQYFVNVKIDREERPDLDHIYMDAVQAITGSGGWPLNIFLTPSGKPFYGGTYFPPVKAFSRASWKEVLYGVADAWSSHRAEVEEQANNLTDYLKQSGPSNQQAGVLNLTDKAWRKQCDDIYENILLQADKEWGGFGPAPKFPQFFVIRYLLQYYYFTDKKDALEQALLSIDKMLEGGIYDHVGGGLARYSTDKEWLVPHFEKMLYDNALLVDVLSDAFRITKDEKYEDAIRKTITFIERELLSEEGGFYAALDADSEGEEGKYYVWSRKEVENILGDKAAWFCNYFDVTIQGNWEGKNILRVLHPVARGRTEAVTFKEEVREALQELLVERNKRIPPVKDDKIILSWNALMLVALCKAYAALQEEHYLTLARQNMALLKNRFRVHAHPPALFHTYKNDIAKYPAFLDDYSYYIDACLHLYEATWDAAFLEESKRMVEFVLDNFGDSSSDLLFYTSVSQQDMVARKKEIYDGAVPSSNAVMARNLFKLAIWFDLPEWRKKAAQMLQEMISLIIQYPSSFAIWAALLQEQVQGMQEITVLGKEFQAACKEIQASYIPNKILMATGESDSQVSYPMLKGKDFTQDLLIYCCKNYTCQLPETTVQNLLHTIRLER